MAILEPADMAFARTVSEMDYSNPFTPGRIELERRALGADFTEIGSAWNLRADSEGHSANLDRLIERAEVVARGARERLVAGAAADADELRVYEDLVIFVVYHRFYDQTRGFVVLSHEQPGQKHRAEFYEQFLEAVGFYLRLPGVKLPGGESPEKLFAFLLQVRRAFFHIFNQIVGSSRAISRLRAAVWQSIFTHDARRYRKFLYSGMGDITTLITGPSGTGKELVARAIGLARLIPFDPRSRTFAEDFATSFHALNLSALSPTLIESELFGHARGAFTGAISDRGGWLETCGTYGTVFLDEIGELDPHLQVKLLRVLQARMFSRLGESRPRRFEGKMMAATNRDLASEIAGGRFREDLYYRLCSDMISTPSLREQLADDPGEIVHLIRHIARQFSPEEAEALSREVLGWIHEHLGDDYGWPGNFRELEQCVRNVLIRGEYRPLRRQSPGVREEMAREFVEGRLSAEEQLRRYCTMVYAQTGSYVATAERLGIDRRTVKGRIDEGLLGRLGGE